MARRISRIVAALGALALALAMTGCAGRPGTAATVGPERISVTKVQQTTDALTALYGQVPGLASYVLNVKMRATAAEQITAAQGVDLRAEAERELSIQDLPAGGAESDVRDFLVSIQEIELLESNLAATSIKAEFAKIPVTVNPRYGLSGLEEMRLDANRLPVLANPSLSKPHGAVE
jgi:hypothetical protein